MWRLGNVPCVLHLDATVPHSGQVVHGNAWRVPDFDRGPGGLLLRLCQSRWSFGPQRACGRLWLGRGLKRKLWRSGLELVLSLELPRGCGSRPRSGPRRSRCVWPAYTSKEGMNVRSGLDQVTAFTRSDEDAKRMTR